MNDTTPKDITPKLIHTLTPDRQLTTARFSPDGATLAATCIDASIRRWDFAQQPPQELGPLTGHHGWATDMVFASDGRLFTADSWGQLTARHSVAASPKVLWSNESAHDGWIRQMAIRKDGRTLATCGRDGYVRLWSTDQGKRLAQSHAFEHGVYALVFSPDGQWLYVGDERGTVHRLSGRDLKPDVNRTHDMFYRYDRIQDVAGLRRLMFSRDGKTLFAAGAEPKSGGFVKSIPLLHELDPATCTSRRHVALADDTQGFIFDMHEFEDGTLAIVTSGQPGQGKLFYHRPGEDKPAMIYGKILNAHAVTMHPDGKRFVVAATNNGSGGNGRRLGKDGEYANNISPLHLFERAS